LHWFSDLLELDLGNMEVIDVPAQVQLLVEEREQARLDKDWEKADALRARIEEMGFTVNDTDTGVKIGRL
jgi:cysteinyl-tRNA synthetase